MKTIKIIFSFALFFLTGCQGIIGQASFQPTGLPLKVSVDTNGNVSFEVEKKIDYPTALGTFSVGVVVDPVKYFSKDSTLTVRIDCKDSFYDLHGRDFTVDFEPGYYEKISLTKRGEDILLELRMVGSGTTLNSGDCPSLTPASLPATSYATPDIISEMLSKTIDMYLVPSKIETNMGTNTTFTIWTVHILCSFNCGSKTYMIYTSSTDPSVSNSEWKYIKTVSDYFDAIPGYWYKVELVDPPSGMMGGTSTILCCSENR